MLNTEMFIEKAKSIHGDKYDYSKVEYNGCFEKICIICPKHGEFWQTPSSHLQGYGCKKCSTEKNHITQKHSKEDFIKMSCKIHGNKYDYSKVEYNDSRTKVCIICPEHGEFWQTPDNHLRGHGCQKCNIFRLNEKTRMAKEDFIEKSIKIHGDKYDYSNVEYVNCDTPVKIICKIHGEFWQTPYNHLHKSGCPYCRESKLEKYICKILFENKINFNRQKRFDWLGKQSLDFYLPDYNIAIECQGRQHFEPINYFGGKSAFEYRKRLDEIKRDLCEKNKISLLYFSDKKWNENMIINKDELIETINRKN